uniref:Uncharacterized protein n=1 Tax=Pyrodinium bahamense TaxID=73915 RepID=A0A7S0A4K4_9DINO|mmetsp:Transcript_22148/g.61303  ORF Transcript_22148/g.61303 Transcript_22148/m.61303 type:complete len:210 (+) Transcript_22148:92-721(+)
MSRRPPAVSLGPRSLFRVRDAVLYHIVYHRSRALHANHLLFLHTCLLGILVGFEGAFGVIANLGVISVYGVYCLLLTMQLLWRHPIDGFLSFLYIGVLSAISRVSHEMIATLRGRGMLVERWSLVLAGFSVMLGSFLVQLVGHAAWEEFSAPINLVHGSVTAGNLEWLSALLRLGLLRRGRLAGVIEEADRIMSQSRAELECWGLERLL